MLVLVLNKLTTSTSILSPPILSLNPKLLIAMELTSPSME